jgi:hypothetical protein
VVTESTVINRKTYFINHLVHQIPYFITIHAHFPQHFMIKTLAAKFTWQITKVINHGKYSVCLSYLQRWNISFEKLHMPYTGLTGYNTFSFLLKHLMYSLNFVTFHNIFSLNAVQVINLQQSKSWSIRSIEKFFNPRSVFM